MAANFLKNITTFFKKVPEEWLYKDVAQDSLILPKEGFRFPSPGSQKPYEVSVNFPKKTEKLAKTYYYTKGQILASEAGIKPADAKAPVIPHEMRNLAKSPLLNYTVPKPYLPRYNNTQTLDQSEWV